MPVAVASLTPEPGLVRRVDAALPLLLQHAIGTPAQPQDQAAAAAAAAAAAGGGSSHAADSGHAAVASLRAILANVVK